MPQDLADIMIPEEGGQTARKDDITVEDVLQDYKAAFESKRPLMDAMKQDFEFKLGKQWDAADIEKQKKVGVRALTINKCATNIELLKGVESQSRSDFRAYPEGEEDTLEAEIVTRLMKNAVKKSDFDFKSSEMFENGVTAGESHLEPYLYYPYKADAQGKVDMTAELRWRHNYYDSVVWDPDSKEYDHSDARYYCKLTTDITKEELISMFPDKKDEIEELGESGKIDLDKIASDRDQAGYDVQRRDYRDEGTTGSFVPKNRFDLLDYYYVKWVPKYYIADFAHNEMRLAKNKQLANRYVKQAIKRDKDPNRPSAKMIERLQPEIWVAFVTGGLDEFLAQGPAWSFPRWGKFPMFTFYCYKSGAPLQGADREYLVQGLTRRIKDQNRELNKRRTQELRHLNQSANSGWIGEEDAFFEEDKWEEFGSSPGVVLKHKKGSPRPEKILPTPLSQGHSQMAAEHTQDMRESVGINQEALAIDKDDKSGVLQARRVKQTMVMVQGIFDNYARTRRPIGQFILAVLPELYTVEKAMRVLGESFLDKNFRVPVTDPATGQPIIDPMSKQPMTQYDPNLAMQTINKVLNDTELGVYDIAVGENISNETVQLAQFMELREMNEMGIPVPPDVIVDASSLSNSNKKKILSSLAAIQAQGGQPPQKKERKK